MKTQSETIFGKLNKKEIENLTTQVDETLAKEYTNNTVKTFHSVDMWNIHRRRRSLIIR